MFTGRGMLQIHVLLVLLFSSAFSSASLHAQPLRIGVSETILSLPLYVAENQGFFKKQGVDVQLVKCIGGNRCMRNMLAGETELSTATELPVVFNSFERSDFAILTSFVNTPSDLKIVARKSANVLQVTDLKNKTVGYVKGTASHYVLDLMLVYNGIDPAAVSLKAITPETALSALGSGQVDAVCIWEPFAARIQQNLDVDVQLVPTPRLYTENFNLIAMNAVIRSRPAELEKLLLALKDSTNFIGANPEKAKALLVDRFELPRVLVDNIFDDYRYRLGLNRSLSRTMEGQARWALRGGHVNRTLPQPNYLNYLNSTLLKQVDPDAVLLP